ncbi:hypothetical protein HMPREF9970_1992 [Lachnoanaerobaculum saburreum F0468]|uniref:Uncharacterized protein n=1 Tax=Lachnoanaerobaculum saburreum F0468 TaxID=1095750 RepID=I0R4X1_9FIRM|nr:hypothetical protein HMPREF9970_1992 [Lachnoanaerobaculum saburreum F0468]
MFILYTFKILLVNKIFNIFLIKTMKIHSYLNIGFDFPTKYIDYNSDISQSIEYK